MASLNDTPSAERTSIGFFGLRNAGKSSLVNAIAGQEMSLVSEVKGTTTDPVRKAMELLPLGPVVLIDTPGLDDTDTELGRMRVAKARETLGRIDVAVVVQEAAAPASPLIESLAEELAARKTPFVRVLTKCDLAGIDSNRLQSTAIGGASQSQIRVSAKTGFNIRELKELIASLAPKRDTRRLVGDLLAPGDRVVLVVPIDAAAPKGRLILPQQQVLRDILDAHALATVCQPEELAGIVATAGRGLHQTPPLVITDSQAFKQVSAILPKDWPLTSFSILFARYKGDLAQLVSGAKVLRCLTDSDRVLVCEACTHHRQCGDIGTEKIPAMIRRFSGANPQFRFTSGADFPEDLSGVRLIVHCGGCMLNQAAMASRLETARRAGVPIVNYGIAIACMNGILDRALAALH